MERVLSNLSPEQLAFIRRSLKSVWALELLLLLRADRERGWTTEQFQTWYVDSVSGALLQ